MDHGSGYYILSEGEYQYLLSLGILSGSYSPFSSGPFAGMYVIPASSLPDNLGIGTYFGYLQSTQGGGW